MYTHFCLQFNHYLPDEMQEMRVTIDNLPGHQLSPTAPFAGLVVNINCITQAHRDKDKMLCMVAPLGPFEGADLCFYEQGLVIPLRSGDLVIFRSSETTHFNLHFQGMRASLVFHTDKELDVFTETENHWSQTVY